MSRAGVALRLAILAIAVLALWPLQRLALWRGSGLAGRLPVVVHRLLLRLFSVRVRAIGRAPDGAVPTLILANHVSWLDIPVIASLRPLSFVAKSEIAGWPMIGRLAALQRTVFLDRGRRGATAEVNALLGRRLAVGEAVVLFAEGTTGDGLRLLPFRTSLVGAARAALGSDSARAVRLQPLAIHYPGRGGLPVGRADLPDIAWYGDTELVPHLRGFVAGGAIDAVVVWGEPVLFDATSDRKRATAAAEAAIGSAIAALRRSGALGLFSPVPESGKDRPSAIRDEPGPSLA